MSWRLAIWLCGSATGALLLAVHDDGPRLIAFSDAHGLTRLDALAVAILLPAWLPIAAVGWRRRGELIELVGRPTRRAATFLAGFGTGLIVASVFGDFGGWWLVGAFVLATIQLGGLLLLIRR